MKQAVVVAAKDAYDFLLGFAGASADVGVLQIHTVQFPYHAAMHSGRTLVEPL